MKKQSLLIITGMSGAGKTSVIGVLEDFGFFCMDNVPPALFNDLVSILSDQTVKEAACVVDVRSITKFGGMDKFLDSLKASRSEINIKIIFLDADDDVLVYRYIKTRRAHPLQKGFSLEEAIDNERHIIRNLKKKADFVINTTGLDMKDLKEEILSIAKNQGFKLPPMRVEIQSFSFSKGVPHDANLVFDVRFLPNPYYAEDLTNLTGKDKKVREYIEKYPALNEFLENLLITSKLTIDGFSSSGRNQLKIAIGCTGGQHRSVYVAEKLYKALKSKDINVSLDHREEKFHKEKKR